MIINSNQTAIKIKCNVRDLFAMVTAPKNWLGLHPVTKGIYGPNIENSLAVGDVCIEHIVNPERPGPIDAVWVVTEKVDNVVWSIESIKFGNEQQTIFIQYNFYQDGEYTNFIRTMVTKSTGNVDARNVSSSASPHSHDVYLENLKKRMEN